MKINRRSFVKKMGTYGTGLVAANVASIALSKRAQAVKEITTTFMKSGTYDLAAESIEQTFEKETGIELEIVTSPWAVLNQNHIADLTTGTGEFDVMSGEFWIATVFNHMLPLDSYVKRDGYGSTIIDRLWEPGPSNFFGGKGIGVPHSADAYSIIYRKDIFDKYNIDPNWTTWKEYIYTANQLKKALNGDLNKLKNCIKITGYVNASDNFIDQPKVINPASETLSSLFSEKGKHSRAAVSVNSLPLGAAVEIDAIFEV